MPQMEQLICGYQRTFENRYNSRISATSNVTRAARQPLHPTIALRISVMVLSGPEVLKDRRRSCNRKGAASHFSHTIGYRQGLSAALHLNQSFRLWLTLLPTLVPCVTWTSAGDAYSVTRKSRLTSSPFTWSRLTFQTPHCIANFCKPEKPENDTGCGTQKRGEGLHTSCFPTSCLANLMGQKLAACAYPAQAASSPGLGKTTASLPCMGKTAAS